MLGRLVVIRCLETKIYGPGSGGVSLYHGYGQSVVLHIRNANMHIPSSIRNAFFISVYILIYIDIFIQQYDYIEDRHSVLIFTLDIYSYICIL